MCGIAGIVGGRAAPANDAVIRAMTDALVHRGPDREGFWQEGPVWLGHRRLSVLDLSPAGDQPMVSGDRRFVLTYNGEIYNHLDLRRALEHAKPIAWRGTSDTETLVEALAHWGVDETLGRINGMFAFGLWDRMAGELVLARDPFGEKPLYYGAAGDSIAFGSEYRCLERVPWIDAGPDPSSVATYLRRWYLPAPHSIGKAVFKLPEGCVLTWRTGRPAGVRTYWSISDAVVRGREAPLSDRHEAVKELEVVLADAVRVRMLSDVPLGALLSGGIDSSLVVALMQAASTAPIRTFSLGFNEAAFNEAEHAKVVSQHLGTEHTELYITDGDARSLVPRLGSIYDEPFADSSQIPTALICQLARRHVTVALTGDGGDELFAGYTRYPIVTALWRRLARLPMRRQMAVLVEHLPIRGVDLFAPLLARFVPPGIDPTNLGAKLRRSGPLLRATKFAELYSAFLGGWANPLALVADPTAVVKEPHLPALPSDLSEVDWMMWWDSCNLLPNDLLVKVDRASMAVSLESRMPLLDRRVAGLAWRMPIEVKSLTGISKWPLRAILHKYIPKALVDRPKMGFGVPLDLWLRGGLRSWASDLLSPSRLRRQGLLQPEPVDRAWRGFLAGGSTTSSQVWTLLMLQTWMEARGR